MTDVQLERPLRVPAAPAATALGELFRAIAEQTGAWRGFALHISLGDLRLPDVGYVAVPIALTVAKSEMPNAFEIAFTSSNLPAAFPAFQGRMGAEPGSVGECTLYLRGSYELPIRFVGRLIDAAMLPQIANRSLENFIDEIGAACEARVNQNEAEFARYHFYARTLR